MNIDPIARRASAALHEASADLDPPDIAGVRRTRRNRSGVAVAVTAFAVTIAVLGGFTLWSPGGEPAGDVGTTGASQPTVTTSPPTSTSETPTTGVPNVTTPPLSDAVLAGNVFILDDGSGPEICSAVMESLPPQCSGPALDGLDWADIPWADAAQGVIWADMYIQVRYLEGRFALVADPTEPVPVDRDQMDFSPPCEAPDGGWTFEHGPGTSNEAFEAAMRYVAAQPDQAGAWVYNLDPTPSEFETAELVIVAGFTGDLAAHEAAITGLWDGPLCVFERSTSEAELRAIQDELASLLSSPEWPEGIGTATSFSVDVTTGTVEVGALFVTAEGLAWIDSRYGPGVVTVIPTLQPVQGAA